MKPLLLLFVLMVMLFPCGAYSLTFPEDERGDGAMADRYALWSKNLIEDGYWTEALFALERSADFSDVSSDICYLLALARSRANKDRGSVLEALEKALVVDRWRLYFPEDAIFLKVENLIALRAYTSALNELSRLGKSVREAELRLKTISVFRPSEFRGVMKDALALYPRESGPVRIFFEFLKNEDARGNNPGREDIDLLELIMRRLPILISEDPELAWMAAPYMRDTAEAKRLVLAYRALHVPKASSLPVALKLGLIGEELAIGELFSAGVLDLALLGEIWGLLRSGEARDSFKSKLSVYSGLISEDSDRDGIPESFAEYHRGMLKTFSFDGDQDAFPELVINFEAGNPMHALVLLPPESSRDESMGNRPRASVEWERYPSLLQAELHGVRYIPRPLEFQYSPVKFVELWGSRVLFPQSDPLNPPLTRRVLVSQCFRLERPSLEFRGGIEVIELSQGIPMRAREYVGDLMVAETDFLRGRPQLQRVDLDFDGRMDTFRFFRRDYRAMELEDLWNYDRDFERVETVHD